MAANALQQYFQPAGQRRAFEAYTAFAGSSGWSVSHKMDLYEASRIAFGPGVAEADAFPAFEGIYGSLRGNWQVFRSSVPGEPWSARKVFDTIRQEFADYAWGVGPTLPGLLGSGRHQGLMFSLMAMRGIKANTDYPTMTVSKFLHFYNPSLFPIYDTEVIENKVFKRFKADYVEFKKSAGLVSRAGDAAFLRNYMCWASSLMASAHPGFMGDFVTWLGNELPKRKFDAIGPEALRTLYATAFEFAAIGAAVSEQQQR